MPAGVRALRGGGALAWQRCTGAGEAAAQPRACHTGSTPRVSSVLRTAPSGLRGGGYTGGSAGDSYRDYLESLPEAVKPRGARSAASARGDDSGMVLADADGAASDESGGSEDQTVMLSAADVADSVPREELEAAEAAGEMEGVLRKWQETMGKRGEDPFGDEMLKNHERWPWIEKIRQVAQQEPQ